MPPRGNDKGDPNNDETVKGWVGRLLLMIIPVVNIIMLIVWATDKSGTHRPRKAFAKAELIFCIIGMILGACIGASASILLHNAKSKLTVPDAYYDSSSDSDSSEDLDDSEYSDEDNSGYSDDSKYSDEDNSGYSDEDDNTDEGYDSSSSNSSDDEW